MDPQLRARQAWIVWFAMVNSQLIIGAVGAWMVISGQIAPDPEAAASRWVLIALGILIGATSLVIGRLVRADFFTVSLLRWAMCEAATLIGFVVCVLTGSVGVLGGMLGYALVLLSLHAPTAAARARSEEPRAL